MDFDIFIEVVAYLPIWLDTDQEEKIADKAFEFDRPDLDVIFSGPFPCCASYITFRVEEKDRQKAISAASKLARYVKRFKAR